MMRKTNRKNRRNRNIKKIVFAAILSAGLMTTGISFAAENIEEMPKQHAEDHMCTMSASADQIIMDELMHLSSEEIVAAGEETTSQDQTSTDETAGETDTTEETTTSEPTTTEEETTTTIAPETTTTAAPEVPLPPETTTVKPKPTKQDGYEAEIEDYTPLPEDEEEETDEDEEFDPGEDSYEDIGVVINDQPEKFGTLYWPLPSEYGTGNITSGFGYRTGTYSGMHRGLDIGVPEGTPIYACADGVVYASYFSDSAGNFTIIQHENGIYTEYMHQSVRYVKAGETVKAGQMIGRVGNTGWSTGPHLHLGVVLSDYGYDTTRRVNPLPYLLEENTSPEEKTVGKAISEADLRLYYSDGTKLTDTVSENPKLVSKLTPLFPKEAINKVTYSGFSKKGYLKAAGPAAEKKNAVALALKPGYTSFEDTWVKYETDDYDLLITFSSAYNKTDKECPLSVCLDRLSIQMNRTIYKKAGLEKPYYKEQKTVSGQYFALGVHVDVFQHGSTDRIDLPDVYQALTDIDMGQAYISLNEVYKAENLIVRNKTTFDKNLRKNGKTNYITSSGNIYSDFSSDPVKVMKSPGTANLFRKTDKLAEEGLDLVFGFTRADDIGLSFYLPKYHVTFKAGKGGSVNVKRAYVTSGDVLEKGAIAKADSGYRLKKWITNQDITVEDLVIKKGKAISMTQIESLAITENLSFTAKFEKKED